MNTGYPKSFTSRLNHQATVVVANAEQEAQLPDEFRPPVVRNGVVVTASDNAADVMLTPEYGQMMAAREYLERARTEFAEYEAKTRKELDDTAQALRTDRNNLIAGYTADKTKLDEDRARLDAELIKFNDAKNGEQPDQPKQPDGAAGDAGEAKGPVAEDKGYVAPAPAAPPGKRTRTARE